MEFNIDIFHILLLVLWFVVIGIGILQTTHIISYNGPLVQLGIVLGMVATLMTGFFIGYTTAPTGYRR